jgi:hypothetical protein
LKPLRDPLAWAALLAALGVTASAEYGLALACGFGPWVAAGVPAALDIYAVRALRAGRDVVAVVGSMIAVQALAHLVDAHLIHVSVPLVVAVSTIAPLVLWRVHRIGHEHAEASTRETVELGRETPQETAPSTGTFTAPGTSDAPVCPPDPGQASPQVAPGDAAPALPEPERIPEPERLDQEAAARAIEDGWRSGQSVRETARLSTRSPAFVHRVYQQLDAQRDAAPAPKLDAPQPLSALPAAP